MTLNSMLPAGLVLGEGVRAYTVEKVTNENIYLRGHPDGQRGETKSGIGALRIIPTQVIIDILKGIQSAQITLDDVIRKNRSEKNLPNLFVELGVEHDPYILGYDSTIYKICEHCINNVVNVGEPSVEWQNISKLFFNCASGSVVGLQVLQHITTNVVSSLLAKRFLVLTGLSGSGKTKIAQAFARWITPDAGWIDDADHSKGKNPNPFYALVPVGADWTGNENIIGYPNGLDNATYVTKPALELVRHALDPAHAATPHFLILDEMNLSHVERYFADILSAIESGEEIPLYEGDERTIDGGAVPRKLRLPENLFFVGTVNVDETTYMFSPKVLDRANVIEFRLEPDGLQSFLSSPKAPRLEELDGKGAAFGSGFVEAAADKGREVPSAVKDSYEQEMLLFFNLLREHNAEFGYRTSYESARFIHFYNQLGGYPDGNVDWFNSAMDAVVVQKFLPKLHGSRSKLEGLLWALAWACGAERIDRGGKSFAAQIREASQAQDDALYGPETLWDTLANSNPDNPAAAARYPLSFDKVMRMWRKLVRDQFVTFAEA